MTLNECEILMGQSIETVCVVCVHENSSVRSSPFL